MTTTIVTRRYAQAQITKVVAAATAAIGVLSQVSAIIRSLGGTSSGGGMITPGGGWSWMGPTHHEGLWQSANEHLAMIKKDEAVLPPETAEMFREWSKRGEQSFISTPESFPSVVASGRSGGGDTYVIQIGEEKIADIVDGVLYDNAQIYQPQQVSTGSMR